MGTNSRSYYRRTWKRVRRNAFNPISQGRALNQSRPYRILEPRFAPEPARRPSPSSPAPSLGERLLCSFAVLALSAAASAALRSSPLGCGLLIPLVADHPATPPSMDWDAFAGTVAPALNRTRSGDEEGNSRSQSAGQCRPAALSRPRPAHCFPMNAQFGP